MKRLGGPPPKIGDRYCRGFRCFKTVVTGDVVAVYEGRDEWAAIVMTATGRDRFYVITNIEAHVGNWRSIERIEEQPDENEAAQKRQRAAWEGGAT